MQLPTFYPHHPILKKHIAYYYFLRTDSPDFNNTYYAFPNTYRSLNIHQNAECEIRPGYTGVFGSPKHRYLTLVQGYFETPLLVNLKGRLDKVTIVFKPLGLNHFMNKSFNKAVGRDSRIFDEWNGSDYTSFLSAFYGTFDDAVRGRLLEEFLLSRYKPFKQALSLEKALELLTDFENERTINEIAAALPIHARAFNRLFEKHFGTTPSAFRKIARFRHSLRNKLFSQQFANLTEIGYTSNFYDQSYFIKMYKNLTGSNPTKFFNSIEKLADEQIIFEFVNR